MAGAIAVETVAWGVLLLGLLGTWAACLLGNLYIVGLNQLEDIPIDRINKPQLPLASGALSLRQGQWIVALSGGAAIALAIVQGPMLLAVVASSVAIGTVYSLPPIRLKRFPFWASLCILTVRGGIVNLGLFLHSRALLTAESLGLWHQELTLGAIPAEVWALTGFVVVFTIAIAIFKDIPDLEGDRYYRIYTFTARLGSRTVFQITRGVVTLSYGGMALVGLGLAQVSRPWFVGAHVGALVLFWVLSTRVRLQHKSDIARFYQMIWKLFFLEYLIVPLACWLPQG
jgi:homogentisate phytyltransferase/homogentisate geranylgeranyltransferase